MRRHYLRNRRFKHNTAGTSYTPKQLASFYAYPPGIDGSGTKIAVIELGGGFVWAPIAAYLRQMGLTAVKEPIVRLIGGAQNAPDGPDGAQGEVELDICVIAGMAPGAQQLVYFAPNTDSGFLAAIEAAIADGVDVISISWGGPENQWDSQTVNAFEAAFKAAADAGITVCAAAGDNGSGDGESGQHADYPASSPSVLGCGGTALHSMSPINETVWNDGAQGGATGGGVSALFPLPDYQKTAGTPSKTHRCVPDVAGVADPETGWIVSIAGQQTVIGGTSAVAPMWAALLAILVQVLGKKLGLVHTQLYALQGWARDILQGSNGMYSARAGYDCCSGIGVPNGGKLLAALKAALQPPAPTPAPPAPTPTPAPPAPAPAIQRTIVVTGSNLGISVDGRSV
jgi:kumamolisin